MKLFNLSFLLVFGLLLASCSKDEKTSAELLQDGTWKLGDIKITGLSVAEACDKDNTWKFGATTVAQNYGALKCDSSDIDENVPYTLSADGKTLTIDGEVGTITTLTESNLSLSVVSIFGTVSFDLVK